jgi:signal transduction histidine kinase
MDRDATFLLSLVMLAAAALVVGVSGWVLFVRDHRAATAAATSHHPDPEGS